MEKFEHKKSLGQNFLNNSDVARKIINEANLNEEDVVLEIGAGEGFLTEYLAEKSKQVLAIEIDDRLIPFLKTKFANKKNVEIINEDILKINTLSFLEKYNLQDREYKVIANIPYYITSPIIRLLLELPKQPKEIILMVQKEVAERIVAPVGKMSILAVSAQFYADVEYLGTIPKKFFVPEPKVDSALVKFIPKKKKSEEDKSFFRVVKIGFSSKRKTLCNNLANGFHKDKKEIAEILEKLNLNLNVRSQELSLNDWDNLRKELG